ncbi:MAG: class I SAM-dependent methyltransferase [Ignavibacteriae bacterium]|nr:class I SAM-dependent methyltransferase [Ignavibacteriota bacterium]
MRNTYYKGMVNFYDEIVSHYYNYGKIALAIEVVLGGRKRVLEIGTGTGNVGIQLAKRGFDVTGVDISKKMLSVARRKIASSGINMKLVRQDVRKLSINLTSPLPETNSVPNHISPL